MTGAEVAEILARWTAQGVTGAIEWKDDKRRRLFFFEAGQLVALQSNLKSESPGRVAEKFPDLDADALREKVVEVRLRGALEELGGTVESHIGAEPPAREPTDLFAALWAVADTLPRPSNQSFPRLRPGGAVILAQIPLPSVLGGYLADLDGSRPIDDVTAFGPADPETIFNALSLGVLLGAIEAQDQAAPSTVVTTQRLADTPVAAPSPAAPATDEIGALIDAEIAAPVAEVHGHEVSMPRLRTDRRAVDRGTPDRRAAGVAPDRAPPVPEPARIRAATNHFEVLGVPTTASEETLRQAYFALVKAFHPDRWTTNTPEQRREAADVFDLVRGAWEVLADADSREAYIARVIRGDKTEDEKAMERVREILEAESDFKRGVSELAAGRLASAQEILTSAAARVPEDLEMAAYAAFAAFRVSGGRDARKTQAAIDALKRATEQKEKFDQGYVMLGMMHVAQEDDDAARAAFVAALKIRPANPDAVREMRRLKARQEADDEPSQQGILSWFFRR